MNKESKFIYCLLVIIEEQSLWCLESLWRLETDNVEIDEPYIIRLA